MFPVLNLSCLLFMIFLDPYLLVSPHKEMKIFNIKKKCMHKMDMFPIYSSDILVPLTEWPLDI